MSDKRLGERAVWLETGFKKRLERVPESKRGIYERAALGTASPRQAIKAKCFECVGYEDIPERVGRCGVMSCPIWAYRPHQDATP